MSTIVQLHIVKMTIQNHISLYFSITLDLVYFLIIIAIITIIIVIIDIDTIIVITITIKVDP